jgi:hypothetical protein
MYAVLVGKMKANSTSVGSGRLGRIKKHFSLNNRNIKNKNYQIKVFVSYILRPYFRRCNEVNQQSIASSENARELFSSHLAVP